MDLTSGSTGALAKDGVTGRSMGRSTSAKTGRRLRLAVFEYFEVFLGQTSDDVAALVGDDGVDFDEIDVGFEGHLRLRGARGGRRLLRVETHANRQSRSQQRMTRLRIPDSLLLVFDASSVVGGDFPSPDVARRR